MHPSDPASKPQETVETALLAVAAGGDSICSQDTPAPEPAPGAEESQRDQIEILERRLTVLSETVRAAGCLLDPGMVSRFIMDRTGTLLRAEHWRLLRVDEAAGHFRRELKDAGAGSSTPASPLMLGEGLAGWVASQRRFVVVKNPAADPRWGGSSEWDGAPPERLAVFPLISRGRTIAVAELALAREAQVTDEDLELASTLLEPAAVALENAILFRKLEERTVTDDLTHLYNGRFMENYLKREAKRAQRYGHPVSLLFLDLDGFKQVNDVHGHMAGSRTLVEVGELLRKNVRDLDVVARWGGDEFAIVLPETGAAGASVMAQRICRLVADHHFLVDLGLDVRITVSIGVASWPEHGRTQEALLAAADRAMYSVKYSGKDGTQLAEPAGERE